MAGFPSKYSQMIWLRIIKNKVKLTCDSIIFYGHLLLRVSKTFSKFDFVFEHEGCVNFWDFPFVEAPPNMIEFGDIHTIVRVKSSEWINVNPENLTSSPRERRRGLGHQRASKREVTNPNPGWPPTPPTPPSSNAWLASPRISLPCGLSPTVIQKGDFLFWRHFLLAEVWELPFLETQEGRSWWGF